MVAAVEHTNLIHSGHLSRVLVVSTAFILLLLLSIPIILYTATDTAAIVDGLLHRPNATPVNLTVEAGASWVDAGDLPANYTAILLSRWLTPGGSPCRDSLTTNVTIPGLDGGTTRLAAGKAHEFVIQAVDEGGSARCLGGDYFEADLTGGRWKSRPPLRDNGDGTYLLTLQVHPSFTGRFNFTLVLLYRRYEGLKFSPGKFAYEREVRRVAVEFYDDAGVQLPELRECREGDWSKGAWAGRWTRHRWRREEGQVYCDVDGEGRYRCVENGELCEEPWCYGRLGSLESSGWVYSAHCSFRLFSPEDGWDCLNNKWLFFWGDSNHVDTIRNLLNFVLGRPEIKSVPRRFDRNFSDPSDGSRSVRITSIFNGHWNDSLNYEGLNSLQDPTFADLLHGYLSAPPDFMILNSGLHDGIRWRSIRAFVRAAEHAAAFFTGVFQGWEREGRRPPALFYRTTVATGGHARRMAFNPSKMEAFNGVMVEKMRELMRWGGGVIDHFDMTFPWHFDNRCNDGVHYGRAPAIARWRDGEVGHQYFVDLMLAHVLLNAVCNRR